MAHEIVDINKGYVKIANNLFENIIFRDFTNRERAVICLIIRLSYGFNHKVAVIKPKARFCLIGVHRQHIDRTLINLIDKKVVLDCGNDEYALNKHFDEWQVNLNRHFDKDNFNALKGLQFREDVTPAVTNCNQNDNEECNNGGYKNVTTEVTESNQTVKTDVTTVVTDLENCNNGGYNDVTPTVTNLEKMLQPRLQEQPENTDGANNTTEPKDIIKDNINTSLNTCIKEEQTNSSKKFDPYFNNPLVEKFKKEYERIFNKPRCYLNNFQINKIIEICAEAPEFIEKLPEILEKMKKIKFSQGSTSIKWLLESGNWSGILNGEFDKYIQEETPEDLDGWDIGIPTFN